MKKLLFIFMCMSIISCGEKPKEQKSNEIKQPFKEFNKDLKKEKSNEIKQPFTFDKEAVEKM